MYHTKALCGLFGVSKQAYYQYLDHGLENAAKVQFVLEYVHEIRGKDPGIGGEKLWVMYKSYFGVEYSLGRDSFCRILCVYGLTIRKRRKRIRTTDSNHPYLLYPNQIQDLIMEHPNQVWVSDITYIRIREKFCFLSLITDAYDKEIVGYYVAPTLQTEFTIRALQQALSRIEEADRLDLIHHSDRGVQYASDSYTRLLKENHIRISMTEKGDPKENAIAERVNGILKHEFLEYRDFKDIEEVRTAVAEAVEFYNTQRPHKSLDMMTPMEASLMNGPIKKRWRSYREEYLQNNLPVQI